MQQILIAKDTVALNAKIGGGTIAGIKEVNQLAAGALAIFASESNTLLTTGNVVAQMADKKGVTIYQGSGDADKGSDSIEISRRLGTDYRKKVYAAPVKVVKVIGAGATNGGSLNLPSPLVAGTEAYIRVTNRTNGLITTATNIKRYSYVLRTGDTAATIIAALLAAINNDPDSIVVATANSNTGIILTAKDFSVNFDVSLDGILISATLDEAENPLATTDSVAINYGEGTYEQIAKLELMFSPAWGNTNQLYMPTRWWTKAVKADSTETYDVYTISFSQQRKVATGGNVSTVMKEYYIAIPNAATQQSAFETIMAEIFGNAETEETGA